MDGRIYLVFIKERGEQRGERLENWRGEGVGAAGNKRDCGIGGSYVCLRLRGVAHHSRGSLSVIEMTNWAAFFGSVQELKLGILSLTAHPPTPRP